MTSDVKKVLLVDDDRLCRKIAEIYLVRVGKFNVLTAESGPDALELAEHEQPDLLLLDTRMPGMDGYATLSKLRENEATRDIPVIFLTAGEVEDEYAHAPGVLGTIIKGNLPRLVEEILSLTKDL